MHEASLENATLEAGGANNLETRLDSKTIDRNFLLPAPAVQIRANNFLF